MPQSSTMIAQAAQGPVGSAARGDAGQTATGNNPNHDGPAITAPTQFVRSGANRDFNRSILALCDTHLASAQPKTLQALGEAVINRYKRD